MSGKENEPVLQTEGVTTVDQPFVDEEVVQPERMEFGSAANITRSEAREALLSYVAEHCCYGKEAAEKLIMDKVVPSNALHYTLETFCEGRFTTYSNIPHRGGAVDGPYNGRAPDPWDIRVTPSAMFVDEGQAIRIPHTSEVKTCGTCRGSRTVTCSSCSGSGYRSCSSCSGRGEKQAKDKDGHTYMERCRNCSGRGENRCSFCNGSGTRKCYNCDGYGKVEEFKQLNVRYKNHISDHILEGADLPSVLVRTVQGEEIFSQSDRKVWPITAFPERELNMQSVALVNEARRNHPKERQLQQRQTLVAIPVTRVEYTFGTFRSKFWVYGFDRKVYAPDYPQQTCCGCNIL